MLRVRQVEININNDTKEKLLKKVASKLRMNPYLIKDIKINKKSLDARRKPDLYYNYEVDVEVENEVECLKRSNNSSVSITPKEEYIFNTGVNKSMDKNIVIVGLGPAGLMCGYVLLENGYKVTLIDRGDQVEDRVKKVEEFWNENILDENSNVQFGEGGAGTFSDGKLNTLIKDKDFRMKKVFDIFIENGAPREILYEKNPHIGTDLLRNVIVNMRNKMIKMGGVFKYRSTLTNIAVENNQLKSIEINNETTIDTDILVLAIGHSARDTFKMLLSNNLEMTSKPFAVGIRIMHNQEMINKSQYGFDYPSSLPPASYKLTHTTVDGRGVYTVCMCPGGYVVNSSSEEGLLAVNGMSNYKRESSTANSAIIVTVTPDDFASNSPLAGIEFQRSLEGNAYNAGKGLIPIQLYGDFKNNTLSKSFKSVQPVFKGGYAFSDVRGIFPSFISKSIIEGIESFSSKINNYNQADAIIAGVESRTSSPVKIIRDENLISSISGIYPCGEGAGYAGGITSAGMDGIKVAEAISKN